MKQWVSLGLFDCEPSPKRYWQGPRSPKKRKGVTKSGCKLAWKQAFPDAGFVLLLYHYLCKKCFCTSDSSSSARSHVGSFVTIEEQKKVDSWRDIHFRHTLFKTSQTQPDIQQQRSQGPWCIFSWETEPESNHKLSPLAWQDHPSCTGKRSLF